MCISCALGFCSGIGSDLVDNFRGLVVDTIWNQLHYLLHYNDNIEELGKKLVDLENRVSSVKHQIREATDNGEKIEEEVLHWLNSVSEITEQAQNFEREESQANSQCTCTQCPNLCSRLQLSRRAKEMALKVVEIHGKQFQRIAYRESPEWKPDLTNIKSNEEIDSRVSIMNQIMEALQDPSIKMIGLCGLGGVGKTTISKEVAKKVKDEKMFEKAIMAEVKQHPNIKTIQGQIAYMLGLKLDEENDESIRASLLCDRLKQEKNLLLILDDLWKELEFAKVGIPFTDGGKYNVKNEGCKILLTSRNRTLLSNQMKCERNINVDVLDEKEAWELFRSIAELSTDSDGPDLISVATEIVRECQGLPLAIVAAAKALRKKDLTAWNDALKRLKKPLRRGSSEIDAVDKILRYSYDHLSPKQQDIFLLSAMLSHDSLINDLLMYFVGLDLHEHVEDLKEAQDEIFTVVSELKASNLLLDSISNHHFTMHDVVRDVALSIAFNERHFFVERHVKLKKWPNKNSLEGYRRICLEKCDISGLPKELHGPGLEFFLFNSTNLDLTVPNIFFNSAKELKVLAFINLHFSSLPSLSFLEELRTLCLHSCQLEDITEVASLKNLNVLSLAYSEIECLPSELEELTFLQMLNLAHCYRLKVIPPKLLSSLKNLEVLHMENSFNQWEAEGSSKGNDNASLSELMDLPISTLDIHIPDASVMPKDLFLVNVLERYKIFIGEDWRWPDEYETSRTLKLKLKSSIHLEGGVQKLLERVEELHLDGSNGLASILYDAVDGRGFPCLKHLRIQNNDDIEFIVFNSIHLDPAFPILETLILQKLNGLKKLCQGPIAVNKVLFQEKFDNQLPRSSFSNLKTLDVSLCDSIVKLVPFNVLKSLNNLEELEVVFCEMLEVVFDFEELNYKETQTLVVVPLKKLKLHNLPKLKNVWSDHLQGIVSFQNLRHVDAYECMTLTSIFPAFIAKSLLHLEVLDIVGGDHIEVIVAKDQVSEPLDAAFLFPKLTSLQLAFLPNLMNFYPQRQRFEWPHLQWLSIRHCDELEIFEIGDSGSSAIYEEECTLDSTYPLLSHEKVIPNLEQLELAGKEAEMIWKGQLSMYHFHKVKWLHLGLNCLPSNTYGWLKMFPKLEDLELSGMISEIFSSKEPLGDVAASLVAPFRTLTLEQLEKAKYIWNQHTPPDLFRHLQFLDVSYSPDFISLGPSFIYLVNLTHIDVRHCRGLTNLLMSSTARSLVNLTSLEIWDCHQIEEIITKQQGEDDEEKDIIFSKLTYLRFSKLPRLKSFCSHNYTFKFPLLDHLFITECPRFKIFSPGFISAPSLKSIEVARDEKFWDTNLNNTILQRFTHKENVMVLNQIDATMIRNDRIPVDLYPQVTTLYMENFDDEWVTFPYEFLERFPSLHGLYVEHSSFEEIFPSQAQIVDPMRKIPYFNRLYLTYLDKLKSIWKDDSQLLPIHRLETLEIESCCSLINLVPSSASFKNLSHLKVSRCHQLIYLVTYSTSKSLGYLRTLVIKDCREMEEIITHDENIDDAEGGITFNWLSKLVLTDLPNLKRFCSESYPLKFEESLEISITGCFQMRMSCSGVLKMPKLTTEEIEERDYADWKDQVDIYKALQQLFSAKVSPNFEKMTHLGTTAKMIWNGQFSVEPFPKVKQLHISGLENATTFPYGMLIIFPILEELQLHGETERVVPQPLRKYESEISIFSSDEKCGWVLTNLFWDEMMSSGPSFISLPYLTCLHAEGCHELTNLMTSSTARSLIHLTSLTIGSCHGIKEIITKQEVDEDKEKDIIFSKLAYLKLQDLLNLKSFCSHNYTFMFPLLNQVIVTQCPSFKIFSPGVIHTPSLQRIQVADHQTFWDTNLNNTILQRFTAPKVIPTFYELGINEIDATMIKNDQFPVDLYPEVKTLYVESFVDEWKTFPYTFLERFPKLDWLWVEHSFFEEIFPSQAQVDDHMKRIPPLRKLYLGYLDKLKNIWKDDSQLQPIHHNLKIIMVESCSSLIKLAPSFASFENLTELKLYTCHQLIYLVTISTAKSLVNLEMLEIDDCEKLDEIVINETIEDAEGGITFNRLKQLVLTDLPSLKMFSSERHPFKFPELEKITITRCLQMKMICPGALETPELSTVKLDEDEMHWKDQGDQGDLNKTIQQQFLAKVIPTLEKLTVLGEQAEMIWKGQFSMDPKITKVKQLHITGLQSATTFPYGLLRSFPDIEKLWLDGESEHMVALEENQSEISFYSSENLSGSDVECGWVLTDLFWDEMISTEPSFISLPSYLTYLHVEDCDKLTNLLTSSAARSLIHLICLTISSCCGIKEIITKQQGEDDEEKDIIFGKLAYLKLHDLRSLKSFCSQNYSFMFPLLNQVIITKCPFFKIFSPGVISTPSLKSVQVARHQKFWDTNLNNTILQRFTAPKVIPTFSELGLNEIDATMMKKDQFPVDLYPNVETLYVDSFVDEWVTFPYTFLERFPELRWLWVEHSSFEEIFPSQAQVVDHMKKIPPLEKLYLGYLDNLKNIWKDDSQLQPIHHNLKILAVQSCCSLIKLAPSSASLENLTELKVSSCHQLTYLVTNSTAKSLVNLRVLKIVDCKMLDEIVTIESIDDKERRGIRFSRLIQMVLTDLPSLKMFSSQSQPLMFPKLEKITIRGCLQMKMICPGVLKTPKLSTVKIEEDEMDWKYQGDLNKTIDQLFSAKDGKGM